MPIYEYECECGKCIELIQKVTDPPPTHCTCEENPRKVKRVISQTNFQLKGSGWYKDLYSSAKHEAPSSSTGSTPAVDSTTSSASPASSPAPAPATSTTKKEST